MSNSLHYEGLAADLNLYVKGVYVKDEKTNPNEWPAWAEIGEAWIKKNALCRWGGKWGDSNHVSLTDGGRQ